jgi:hypothetical protein
MDVIANIIRMYEKEMDTWRSDRERDYDPLCAQARLDIIAP